MIFNKNSVSLSIFLLLILTSSLVGISAWSYDLTFVHVNKNYDWSNLIFSSRYDASLNLAANSITTILSMLSVEVASSLTVNHVVINEFESNPPGNDNYLSVEEWVELYNPTSNPVDIGGWRLVTIHGETVAVTIPEGTVIEPGGYYVYSRGQQWLDNEDESIILLDDQDREVDRTPILSDTDNDDRCWVRYPNGRDTDSSVDWRFQPSTKGYSNGGEKSLSSISCSVSPSTIPIGESVTVSGAISSIHVEVEVSLVFTRPDGSVFTRIVLSDSSGTYSYVYTPEMVGLWSVKASWEGDADHYGASSTTVIFTVVKASSSISCSLSSSTIHVNENITIYGRIDPPHAAAVLLSFTKPDGSTLVRILNSSSDGTYSYTFKPNQIGRWSVQASWMGDDDHEGATSDILEFMVIEVKYNSTITIICNPSNITIGEEVVISGTINPVHTMTPINLRYSLDEGLSWSTIGTTITNEDGEYSFTWKPPTPGKYLIEASWEGDQDHHGATNTYTLTVSKAQSTLTIKTSKTTITIGETITITGKINPPHNQATITIQTSANGKTFTKLTQIKTDQTGTYAYKWKPPTTGTFHIKATWKGDTDHKASTSKTITLTVKEKETTPTINQTSLLIALTIIGITIILIIWKRMRSRM